MADAVRAANQPPINFAKREIVLTASIGLVSWTSQHTSAEDMLKDARTGHAAGQSVMADDRRRALPSRLPLGRQQPGCRSSPTSAVPSNAARSSSPTSPSSRLEDRTIAGFEAAHALGPSPARQHPAGGVHSDRRELRHHRLAGPFRDAGRQREDLNAWQRAVGDVPLSVSVNLSSRQLLRRDLVNDVRSVIARSAINPRCFRLELTESLIMDNPEQSAHVLAKLKKLGIGLSLDDFGTGYSSLAYLTRFPFDTIKIDRSFLDDTSPKRSVLLRSIVTMAHGLGLAVVAEGISEEADAEELREMGCEFVQSFLFGAAGRPRSVVIDLLKEQSRAVQA